MEKCSSILDTQNNLKHCCLIRLIIIRTLCAATITATGKVMTAAATAMARGIAAEAMIMVKAIAAEAINRVQAGE